MGLESIRIMTVVFWLHFQFLALFYDPDYKVFCSEFKGSCGRIMHCWFLFKDIEVCRLQFKISHTFFCFTIKNTWSRLSRLTPKLVQFYPALKMVTASLFCWPIWDNSVFLFSNWWVHLYYNLVHAYYDPERQDDTLRWRRIILRSLILTDL